MFKSQSNFTVTDCHSDAFMSMTCKILLPYNTVYCRSVNVMSYQNWEISKDKISKADTFTHKILSNVEFKMKQINSIINNKIKKAN